MLNVVSAFLSEHLMTSEQRDVCDEEVKEKFEDVFDTR